MNIRPTLSLLVPAYNAARFLPRLLKSAAVQTVPFDDVWVYDDCSTDNTSEVAAAHGARVLRGDINLGCSVGKNRLARAVETDWIHFHDADDALLPHFVELARKWMDRNDSDVVLFDYEWRDHETDELLSIVRFDKESLEDDPRRYAIVRQINPFCGLYRRSAYIAAGGYNEDPLILYNEDVAFHVKMAFANLSFSSEHDVSIVNYRVGGSMSSNKSRQCAVAHYHVMRKLWERADAAPYRREISEALWRVSGVLASLGATAEARDAVKLASSIHAPTPAVGKPWFRALASFHPELAVQAREMAIRVLKPRLRKTL